MELLYPCSLVTKRTKQWHIQNVCWRDNEVNTGFDITDRRHECVSVNDSQYKIRTGDNQDIKKKALLQKKHELIICYIFFCGTEKMCKKIFR